MLVCAALRLMRSRSPMEEMWRLFESFSYQRSAYLTSSKISKLPLEEEGRKLFELQQQESEVAVKLGVQLAAMMKTNLKHLTLPDLLTPPCCSPTPVGQCYELNELMLLTIYFHAIHVICRKMQSVQAVVLLTWG